MVPVSVTPQFAMPIPSTAQEFSPLGLTFAAIPGAVQSNVKPAISNDQSKSDDRLAFVIGT
jgi:hypothetical protein